MNFRQFVYIFNDAFYHKMLGDSLTDCNSVLDVGCGSNSPIKAVKKTFYSEGIDIYRPSIVESKKNNIHDKYITGNIENIDKYYKNKSFDAVIALDVIEHFDKEDGLKLIEKMEKIARKKVILLTPNGFVHQGHIDNNPYQSHKYGWFKKDLKEQGYKNYGLRSFKFIRGENAMIKLKLWLIWSFITFITEPLVYYFPGISFDLFAIKTLVNKIVKK